MSKLVEKLERTSEAKSPPIGFATAVSREKTMPMVLVAALSEAKSSTIPGMADALLISARDLDDGAKLKKLARGGKPWGVSAKEASLDMVVKLAGMGCDFLVFEEVGTPAGVLLEDNLGKLLSVALDLPDSLARAVDHLPVDAILVELEDASSLTVHQILLCRRLTGLMRKPLLAAVSPDLGQEDVEALCQAGVKGLVVRAAADKGENAFQRLRKAIESIRPAAKKRREKLVALVPQAPEAVEISEPEPEEDEDDD